ncbi:hypothetical protein ACU4GI_30880 [Cupriavidus basilensis]|uniref:hypothetical protein n=5 Tax=Cupriavidus TaxID=106589 RepID=UPI0023E80005|nr:hypothetical protein [Cupriavidus basilensis]MDF3888170.1 hypothetical protein [Cupriavidus basilensis]
MEQDIEYVLSGADQVNAARERAIFGKAIHETLLISEIHPKAARQLTVNDTGCICEKPCFRFLGRLGWLSPVRRKSNSDTLIRTRNLHPAKVSARIDAIGHDAIGHDKPNLEPLVRMFTFMHANLQVSEMSLTPASGVKLTRVKTNQSQFVLAAVQQITDLPRPVRWIKE